MMGVTIDFVVDLEVRGRYFCDERRVEIRAGMNKDVERSVLAHEAAHVELRHEPQDMWCRYMLDERLASAMAGRRLVDFWHFMLLKDQGLDEKEISVALGTARSILRAYIWLASPAWLPGAQAAA